MTLTLDNLPSGVVAPEVRIPDGADQGTIELSATIDKPGKDDLKTNGTLKASSIGGLTDSRTVQVVLAKREELNAPTQIVKGYIHEIEPNVNGGTLVIVVPHSPPTNYRVAAGVEVRILNSKASFADLRVDQYAVVELGKDSWGMMAVRSVSVQNAPPNTPPAPPHRPPGQPPGPPPGGPGPPPGGPGPPR